MASTTLRLSFITDARGYEYEAEVLQVLILKPCVNRPGEPLVRRNAQITMILD
jgi:hypothetical protein